MSLDPVAAGLGLLDTFIGKFVKDKDLAAKLMAEAQTQEMAGEIQARLGNLEINKVEAASGSLFIGGWRPAVGWVCVASLAYQFVLSPLMRFVAVIAMDSPPEFPVLDSSQLTPILIGMLGLGGLRTYEKINNVAKK
jgi:hypothetical protein